MNKQFLAWLKEQEYDWNILYNQNHRTQGEGRIWMLKHVYNCRYGITHIAYNWDELVNY